MRKSLVVAALAAAAIAFAIPAAAEPGPDESCAGSVDNIEYALDIGLDDIPLGGPMNEPPCGDNGHYCPCGEGACYASPCKCRVWCECIQPGAYQGNFAYCMSDLLPGMCPGETWESPWHP